MKKLVPFLFVGLLGTGLVPTLGCPPTGEGEGEGEGGAGEGEGGAGEGEGEGEGGDTLFDRVGGDAGIQALINDFVLNQVVPDPNINAYFSNDTVDANRLLSCLQYEVAAAVGKPGAVYPGIGADANTTEDFPDLVTAGQTVSCRDMLTIHTGLGISQADFDDLIADFVASMTVVGVNAADQATIGGVLGGLSGDIVEDVSNDATIYQRLGRRPGILTALNGADCGGSLCFVPAVLADPAINSFFLADTGLDAGRLVTCLERQVDQATGGPTNYDHANALVDGAALTPTGGQLTQCRSMTETHANLKDDGPGGAGNGISKADFDELETDLVGVLTNLGVGANDITSIATALNTTVNAVGIDADGLCFDVVTFDNANCPALP